MKISKKLLVLELVLTVQATRKASAPKENPPAPVTGISNTIYLVKRVDVCSRQIMVLIWLPQGRFFFPSDCNCRGHPVPLVRQSIAVLPSHVQLLHRSSSPEQR